MVLLGDNGVGKSSVLKALAVALVGSEASKVAGRLVRAGQTLGTVTLITDKNPQGYLTEIYPNTGETQVVSKPSRPLEAESWVALGFPPLRTVSWQRTSEIPAPRPRPSAEDLLPLAAGDVDPRLDKLKQWIIGLDLLSKKEQLEGKQNGRAARILAKFFDIVGRITEGMQVRFEEVTTAFEVKVRVGSDVIIPIEALSQGMTSLYSWVGILVQRLFEIYETSEDPTRQYALVLMDEIDAHMHPLWQQLLVGRLKDIFPNVQMIVSTHSPLIVAGMSPKEVARFVRNKAGRVVRVPLDEDMLLGRTDQLLTCPPFGLSTTLDPETQARVEEYRQLLARREPTPSDQKRLRALEEVIEFRIPPSGESLLERRAQLLLESVYAAARSLPEAGGLRKDLLEKAGQVSQALSARADGEGEAD